MSTGSKVIQKQRSLLKRLSARIPNLINLEFENSIPWRNEGYLQALNVSSLSDRTTKAESR